MAGKDYYKILGIARSASEKEIKQAYRRLARKHHPDVNSGDKEAEARFKELNQAHEVLSDAEKRKKYDQYGERWEQAEQFEKGQAAYGGGRSTWRPTSGGGFEYNTGGFGAGGGFEDLMGGIFGRRPSGRRQPRRGDNIEQPVEVTLEEAYAGTSRTLQLQTEEACSACKGAGRVNNITCGTCQGQGILARPRRLEVKIPAGVKDGSRVRMAGEGQAGVGGGQKGDLFLVVSVQPHERFERKGDDLYSDVAVPLVTAVLGGEVKVDTLKGQIALKIAAETQNGRAIRLSGLGMPKLGGSGPNGDLYAWVTVELPVGLTEEQKQLFEALKASLA